jgi:uncharacterized protein (AIM24 family)
MAVPQLHPTTIHEGQGPGLGYRIEGELVPVLHLALNGAMPIFFEHHVVLWKNADLNIAMHKMKGAFKRAMGGLPIFMTETQGAGEIAFSRDFPGQIVPLPIPAGGSLLVREHQLLAATGNLDYTFQRAGGIGSMVFGNQGFFVDRFDATQGDAVLWVHGNGNLFDINLAAGEMIDVEPGAWVYREASVNYTQKVYGLKTGILSGGGNLVFNRFTGPGRIGLQSGYYEVMGAGADSGNVGKVAGAGVVGGLLGSMLSD